MDENFHNLLSSYDFHFKVRSLFYDNNTSLLGNLQIIGVFWLGTLYPLYTPKGWRSKNVWFCSASPLDKGKYIFSVIFAKLGSWPTYFNWSIISKVFSFRSKITWIKTRNLHDYAENLFFPKNKPQSQRTYAQHASKNALLPFATDDIFTDFLAHSDGDLRPIITLEVAIVASVDLKGLRILTGRIHIQVTKCHSGKTTKCAHKTCYKEINFA